MAAESLLRDIRTSRNLRLQDLAKAAGLSIPGYQQIETGQRTANPSAAQAIAGFLAVPLDRIFMPASFTVRQRS